VETALKLGLRAIKFEDLAQLRAALDDCGIET
jgi:hypothetical protein